MWMILDSIRNQDLYHKNRKKWEEWISIGMRDLYDDFHSIIYKFILHIRKRINIH